ncbi:MAG TPA: amidohydrolase family protein, partial [Steroidobacteraceae bacterium]|nr:amidohydrolase family protein [Steroidobacteraceae bacterium]
VNARTRIGSQGIGAPERGAAGLQFHPDIALLSIANLLKGGVSCFGEVGYSPRDAAQVAADQGMRALIGLPVTAHPSGWAQNATEYLTRALSLRDDYRGHPTIRMGFAPLRLAALADVTLARLATLADELDAGILVSLNEMQGDIDESLARHAVRPLARLHRLGLLTPALSASHAAQLDPAEIELARRTGVGITLCLASDLARGNGLPPLGSLVAAGIRLGVGSDGEHCGPGQDIWTEIKLLALHSRASSPWSVLAAATRGGAAVLGLDAEIGTLERGKWADLCCVDLAGPAMQPLTDPLRQLAFSGGRDMVSDVWVAGRQLVCEGRLTRLDWPALAARLASLAASTPPGDSP